MELQWPWEVIQGRRYVAGVGLGAGPASVLEVERQQNCSSCSRFNLGIFLWKGIRDSKDPLNLFSSIFLSFFSLNSPLLIYNRSPRWRVQRGEHSQRCCRVTISVPFSPALSPASGNKQTYKWDVAHSWIACVLLGNTFSHQKWLMIWFSCWPTDAHLT